jgi:hypothetical protein
MAWDKISYLYFLIYLKLKLIHYFYLLSFPHLRKKFTSPLGPNRNLKRPIMHCIFLVWKSKGFDRGKYTNRICEWTGEIKSINPVVDVLLAVLVAVAVLICHGPSTPVQQIGNIVSCNTNPFRITDTKEYELKSRLVAVCVSTVRHRERGLLLLLQTGCHITELNEYLSTNPLCHFWGIFWVMKIMLQKLHILSCDRLQQYD